MRFFLPALLLALALPAASEPLAPAGFAIEAGPEGGSRAGALAFSPDGKRLAAAIENGHGVSELHLINAATGAETALLAMEEGFVYLFAISPDGSRVATSAGSTVRVWDAATGKPLFSKDADNASFSPDSRFLAAVDWHANRVTICDATTGRELRAFELPPGGVMVSSWSPDGATILMAGQNGGQGQYQLIEAATGKELKRRTGLAESLVSGWFEKGAPRAWMQGTKALTMLDLDSGLEVCRLDWAGLRPAFLAFSAGQKRVAVSGSGGGLSLWDAGPDAKPAILRKGAEEPKEVEPEPGSREPKKEPRDDRAGRREMVIPETTALAISPDGRLLAECREEGIVRLWDLEARQAVRDLRLSTGADAGSGFLHVAAWSPDGRRLATTCAGKRSVLIWDVEAALKK